MISKPVKELIVMTDCFLHGIVPSEHLEHFGLVNIKQRLHTSGLYYVAEKFFLKVSRAHSAEFVKGILDSPTYIDDIVTAKVTYEDGETFECYIPWGDREDTNTYQKTGFSKQGNFLLAVSKNPKFFDEIFSDEELVCDYTFDPFASFEESDEEFDEFEEYEES